MTRQHLWTAATVLGVLLLAGPAVAGQASALDSSEASAFMGAWVVSIEGRGGMQEQNVTIRDEGGKVAARIERGRGGAIDVTDITRDGDDLVLSLERSGRRGVIDVVMTLTLDGEMLNVTRSLAGGQFSQTGTGKKQ